MTDEEKEAFKDTLIEALNDVGHTDYKTLSEIKARIGMPTERCCCDDSQMRQMLFDEQINKQPGD